MNIEETENSLDIRWNIGPFRKKYGPSDGRNPNWHEHIYPSYDKPFEWFFRDEETSDRYLSTFNHEWLTLNEIMKNVYDHTDYGHMSCKRIVVGDREFFDYSVSSFVRAKSIYHAKSFYDALAITERKPVTSSHAGNGYNHGAGVEEYIIKCSSSLVVPLHIEKAFGLRSLYVKYSGRTQQSIPAKTPQQ
ncbi:MAG: hypothetical protein JWM20_322 [Patescibacteria group bacterium]|nr:hypothetical protein [Patescibacteria group bacterium]